ncbi:MAG: aspartate ammonia-lyase [Burkholderiales bacterium]|nr:aspartate ammonia-lyase [Burkholderiales bacterium]
MVSETRIEHDLLGEREVPARAYWGIHTLRALENFPISGLPVGRSRHLVRSLGLVKQAAARANRDLGLLAPAIASAIDQACAEVAAGTLDDQFVVDMIQGGAGTSTNMNANEVIANRALELLGRPFGDYRVVHPIEHVNRSQSTNDVYPTALRLAAIFGVRDLIASMAHLRGAFEARAFAFRDILKIGRTQLQDAVPMTLGQEFSAYAVMLAEDEARLGEALGLLREISLGATAIGTGINTDPAYAGAACRHLGQLTGERLVTSPNLVEATQDVGAFVQLSGILKRVAVKLSKSCNDLRLLSSGPQAGFNEIRLPPRAAGSSIMPGKVNPVIPEVVNQIAFEVIGNDLTITLAAEGGQLQLNAFEPVIAYSLHKSLTHLAAGCRTLADNCVSGIAANADLLAERVRTSVGLATALNPLLGYDKATEIATEALTSGRGVAELVLERGLMTAAELARALAPEALTGPRARADAPAGVPAGGAGSA